MAQLHVYDQLMFVHTTLCKWRNKKKAFKWKKANNSISARSAEIQGEKKTVLIHTREKNNLPRRTKTNLNSDKQQQQPQAAPVANDHWHRSILYIRGESIECILRSFNERNHFRLNTVWRNVLKRNINLAKQNQSHFCRVFNFFVISHQTSNFFNVKFYFAKKASAKREKNHNNSNKWIESPNEKSSNFDYIQSADFANIFPIRSIITVAKRAYRIQVQVNRLRGETINAGVLNSKAKRLSQLWKRHKIFASL